MDLDIDPGKRAEAVDRFVAAMGGTAKEAGTLVDAALAGILDHALETITGSGPVPTSMGELKADQLRFVCLRADRLLKQREVEVLFRVRPATARSILAGAHAVYGHALNRQALVEMRADARVEGTGTAETGLRWRIRFTERTTYDTAVEELRRLELIEVADERPAQRSVEVPRTVERDGKRVSVLPLLQIPAPA